MSPLKSSTTPSRPKLTHKPNKASTRETFGWRVRQPITILVPLLLILSASVVVTPPTSKCETWFECTLTWLLSAGGVKGGNPLGEEAGGGGGGGAVDSAKADTSPTDLTEEDIEKMRQGNEMLSWISSPSTLGISHTFTASYFNYTSVGGPSKLLGVRASKDMKPNDVVVKIPFNSLMTWHTVESDPVLKEAMGEKSKAYTDTLARFMNGDKIDADFYLLPVVLLYHMSLGEKSKYHKYLTYIADTDVSNFPVFLNSSTLSRLYPPSDFPNIEHQATSDNIFFTNFHNIILQPLAKSFPSTFSPTITVRGNPILSLQNYAWAYAMISSRVWGGDTFESTSVRSVVPYLHDSHLHMMSPVAELMNFGSTGGCIDCEGVYDNPGEPDPKRMSFVCKAECEVKEGEEVLFWYNDDCRQDFARTYGFWTEEIKDCRDKKVVDRSLVAVIPKFEGEGEGDWKDRKIKEGNDMLDWASTEGGLGGTHNLEAGYFDYSSVGGPGSLLGVKAKKDMGFDDVVLKVPFRSLLTWHTVENDVKLKGAIGKGSRCFDEVMKWLGVEGTGDFDAWMLPVVVLYHISLGPSSPWYPYWEYIKDTDVGNFAMFMEDERMEEVWPKEVYPNMMKSTREDREWAWEFVHEVMKGLKEEHGDMFGDEVEVFWRPILGYDNYVWAENMVSSRSWGANFPDYHGGRIVEHRGNDGLGHYGPIAELMNFGKGGGCIECGGEYDRDGEGGLDETYFVCRAKCRVGKGEEVLYLYNDDCKQDFARTYGFITPDHKDC